MSGRIGIAGTGNPGGIEVLKPAADAAGRSSRNG
jgi:hypothetical protein